jgi:hypothetical protein
MYRHVAWLTNDTHAALFLWATTAAANSAEFQSLDPRPAQDYILPVMLNDTQGTVRRRRAKMARANVFV